jgi:MFS transporter, NNP family, nitrate/nitrite transporter
LASISAPRICFGSLQKSNQHFTERASLGNLWFVRICGVQTVTGNEAPAANRVLILSTTAFTLLFAVWLMLGVLGVAIKAELALTGVQFAWLTAIAVLSGSVFRLPVGILTDRWGGRAMMTALLLGSAVPCYLMSRARTYEEMLVVAFLYGLAGNSFSAGIAWNAAWFSRERQGFALGTFGAGNVGASLTKLIGPALLAATPAAGYFGGAIPGGWRFVPVLYTALLLVMAAVLYFGTPQIDRKPGSGRTLAAMLQPLKVMRVWRFGLYYVVVFGAYVAFSLWLPNYYKTVFGLGLGTASLLTALFIFPASLLRPLGGWLSDRYGARPVTYVVFAVMGLACIPLCLPKGALGVDLGLGTFVTCVEILAVGMGVGKASVYKYIPDYFPRDVGAVGGLVGTLGALGGFFLPLSFGYLEKSSGQPESCFWVMFALVVASFGWLHLVVTGIKRREARATAEAALSRAA